jgi:NADH-quinone oxidoreductase subunit E
MSWYTAGEIAVWLLIASALGFVLGWLLRGVLRPRKRTEGAALRPTAAEAAAEPERTRIAEVDTGASRTETKPPPPSRFAPPQDAVEARSRVAEIAARTAGPGEAPRDDLVRIHGVGPKIARLLVSMDITSYRQVARFTPSDAAVVNEALEVFPGRIERDDWMTSARELHREVYGTEP